MSTGKTPSAAPARSREVAWACLLGAAMAGGWLAAVAAVVDAGLGAQEGRGASGGEWAALGLLGLGFLVLAVVAGTGAHLAWTGGPVRRLATAALCTAVVCGWRVVGVLLRGFADLDGIDLGMLALFLAAGAILVLLRGRG